MTQPLQLKPGATALVLVDLQKGVVANPTVTPHAAAEVVRNSAALARQFRALGAPVFLVRVAFGAGGIDALKPTLDAPPHTPARAADWSDLVPELEAAPADIVITKKQWGAFYGTELELQLRRRRIDTLVLGGIATNMGVESTARDAYELGFEQVFVEDAMTSIVPDGHAFAVQHMFPRMGRVRSTAQVLQALTSRWFPGAPGHPSNPAPSERTDVMNHPSLTRRRIVAAAASVPLAGLAQDRAADFPSRPVRIILPFAAGGPSDIMTRLLGQQLSELWKQPVVIDNRPGAGGVIGTELLARAPADGHTVGVGSVGTHAINATLMAKLPYDPVADFAPITLLASYYTLLAVHASVPANSVGELVALLKANPDKYAFASAGLGSSAHLVAEMFKLASGTRMAHVPYKGDAPALNDLVAGQVQVMFTNLSGTAMGFVQGGRLKPLAVTSPERTPFAPGVPALAESIPGFQASTWVGFFAPGRTAPEIVSRIHADLARVMQMPAVRARYQEFGAGLGGNPPAEFGAFVKSELARWRPVVTASGAKAE